MTSLRWILPLGLASAVLVAAAPAGAQWYGPPGAYPYNPPPPPGGPPPVGNRFYGYARPLPPSVIVDRLEDAGYDDVADPRLAGSTYVTVATNRGRRVRLVVDAFRGGVVEQVGISNREARLFEDGAEWAPPPAYAQPPAPAYRPRSPYEGPEIDTARPDPIRRARPAAREPEAPRREATLPPPADPRLAPSAPAEARPAPSPAPRAAAPESPRPGQIYGTNPDAKPGAAPARPAAAPRPAPAREARTPEVANPGLAPTPPKPAQTKPAPAEARAEPAKPVRVIQGVTPMAAPSAPEQPAPAPN